MHAPSMHASMNMSSTDLTCHAQVSVNPPAEMRGELEQEITIGKVDCDQATFAEASPEVRPPPEA